MSSPTVSNYNSTVNQIVDLYLTLDRTQRNAVFNKLLYATSHQDKIVLIELLKTKGVTHTQIARALKVDVSLISQYLSGGKK